MKESFYVIETQYKPPVRTCEKCEKGMNEGYLHDLGDDTYCSNDCLDKAIPSFLEQNDLFRRGILFWTTWYDEVEVAE